MSILHVDLNSFYAHCAVLGSGGRYTFDTPLIVGGDRQKRHGIVLAATYPVKARGVYAGMMLSAALALCPGAVVEKADFNSYMRYSSLFMRIIQDYSPLITRYGIDEAYLDYKGCEHLFGDATQVAHTIRKRVKDELGLTVSVGVGDNPLMAKMGSDYKKPDAVTVVTPEFWAGSIMPLPVGRLIYVGRSAQRRLSSIGINTIGELASAPEGMLRSMFGIVGKQMWLNANGIDNTRIGETFAQKSISSSITLPGDVNTLDELCTALLVQLDKVAYRLRSMRMCARSVGVYVRYSDFKGKGRQTRLVYPTDVTEELYATARQLIAPLLCDRPIRLVGVKLSSLSGGGGQISMFEDLRHERLRRMDAAVDAIRDRFGRNTILRGSALVHSMGCGPEVEGVTPFDRRGF